MTNTQAYTIAEAIRDLTSAVNYLSAIQVARDGPDMDHIDKCLFEITKRVESEMTGEMMVKLGNLADAEVEPK